MNDLCNSPGKKGVENPNKVAQYIEKICFYNSGLAYIKRTQFNCRNWEISPLKPEFSHVKPMLTRLKINRSIQLEFSDFLNQQREHTSFSNNKYFQMTG